MLEDIFFEKDNGGRAKNEWVYAGCDGRWHWYYMQDNTYPLNRGKQDYDHRQCYIL